MSNGEGRNLEMIRELRLLEVLEEESEIKQIELAAKVGVAVGTVNWLLKRFAAKGYVKVKRIGQWRWRYLLTPQGVAEKARLTEGYFRNSMSLYRHTRQEAQDLLGKVKNSGYAEVYLQGNEGNDLVDICRLTCLEQGIKVVSLKESAGLHPTNSRPVESLALCCHTSLGYSYGATNPDNVPILHVEGHKFTLEWPAEAPNRQTRGAIS